MSAAPVPTIESLPAVPVRVAARAAEVKASDNARARAMPRPNDLRLLMLRVLLAFTGTLFPWVGLPWTTGPGGACSRPGAILACA